MPQLNRVFLATAVVAAGFALTQASSSASVCKASNGTFYVKPTADPTCVSVCVYTLATQTASGFGMLELATNGSYADADQMYAAGYVEGWLTATQITYQLHNMWNFIASRFPNSSMPAALGEYYANHSTWIAQQIASEGGHSAYWASVSLLERQLDGMMDGYNAAVPPADAVTRFQMQFLSSQGDVLDILPAIVPSMRVRWEELSARDLMDYVHRTTACTALIKIDGNYSELFLGHSTWFPFPSAQRIFKHFNLRLNAPQIVGKEVSFSSYPGYLYSFDDYYALWSTNLFVTETTNDIFNASLYQYIVPQSLFAWHRVRLANLMATDGPSWIALFEPNNMGAYNNQYDIVNVGLFSPGQPLQPNTLSVVEQMPNLLVSGDATADLERGYFPSYNVPYFREIYEYAGYPALVAQHANNNNFEEVSGINYQLAPRAQILRRDQAKVVDTASFAALMRYNDYQNDPYAKGNPWNAVCSRGDLSAAPYPAARPDGCTDSKLLQASWWSSRTLQIINGPTTQGGVLPPFAWSAWPSVPHEGLPAVYNFSFEVVTWPAWLSA